MTRHDIFTMGLFIGSLITSMAIAGTYHIARARGLAEAEVFQGAVTICIAVVGVFAALFCVSRYK